MNSQLARPQTRVQEYRAEGARKADPLAAMVADATADYFEIQSCLAAAILDDLRRDPLTLVNLPHYRPALDLFYRAAKYSIMRQI